MSGTETLLQHVKEQEWYHTLELAPGVVTPGWFDTRSVTARLPFPDLAGRRCLDVGTFDGFWAFEMERRGAREVVAIDILDPQDWDWPAHTAPAVVEAIGKRKGRGEGFNIAHRALGSRVTRLERSVYDLNAGNDGIFDFVYLGSLLLHLRDPVGALKRIREVCSGELLVVDSIDIARSILHPRRPAATLDAVGRPWWWIPNLAGLARMVEAAGFRIVGRPRRCWMRPGKAQTKSSIRPRALLNRSGREAFLRERWGDPHGVVLARSA